MLTSLVVQPRQRGIGVLAPGCERLAHDLDVPFVAISTARWLEVAHPLGDLGGRGWVGHKADAYRLHPSKVPTALARKHGSLGGHPNIGQDRAAA